MSQAGWGPAWYRELGRSERRTFKACVAGWALDGMDVQLYSFVIPALIGLWGISRGQAGQLATAALLMSSLGGWGAGWLAHRSGADAADLYRLVCRLHISVGFCTEL